MTPADNELVERAREGDREALATLLKRHGPAARSAIAGRIPNRFRSLLSEQDVMQQTYADAALSIARFADRGEGSFPAWLTALARANLLDAIKFLRAGKRGGDRRRVVAADDDERSLTLCELLGASTTTPSRVVAAREARQAVTEALAQLPAHYRRAVELYDLQGRPIEIVAAALGRSSGAVYMLRARALERMAEIMGTASRFLSRSR
jgi:RNA polymerase sigma-70 factor (ECF subfamily)